MTLIEIKETLSKMYGAAYAYRIVQQNVINGHDVTVKMMQKKSGLQGSVWTLNGKRIAEAKIIDILNN